MSQPVALSPAAAAVLAPHTPSVARIAMPSGARFIEIVCSCGYKGDTAREFVATGNPSHVQGTTFFADDMLPREMTDAEIIDQMTEVGSLYNSHLRVTLITAGLWPHIELDGCPA